MLFNWKVGVGVEVDPKAWPVGHGTNITYIKTKMSIIYQIGEILCMAYILLILMKWIRLPSPVGTAEQVWSAELPNWKLGVGVEVDPAV